MPRYYCLVYKLIWIVKQREVTLVRFSRAITLLKARELMAREPNVALLMTSIKPAYIKNMCAHKISEVKKTCILKITTFLREKSRNPESNSRSRLRVYYDFETKLRSKFVHGQIFSRKYSDCSRRQNDSGIIGPDVIIFLRLDAVLY